MHRYVFEFVFVREIKLLPLCAETVTGTELPVSVLGVAKVSIYKSN